MTLNKYNWIKYIWKQWMEVVSVKLMYLCHVLHRSSKHFRSISFDVAWLIAYFTAFIQHKHWIQIWHVCLLHKTCPIQTNSVSFHQPNIWNKIESVHVCLVLETCVPLLLYEVGPDIWKIYCFFRRKNRDTTVHNSNALMLRLLTTFKPAKKKWKSFICELRAGQSKRRVTKIDRLFEICLSRIPQRKKNSNNARS